MKKTFLKRGIFVLFLSLQMVQGYAQAYELNVGEMGIQADAMISETKLLKFSMDAAGESFLVFWFQVSDANSKYIFLGSLIDKNKDDNVLKLYLSNGEVFTSPVFGDAFWFMFPPQSASSNRAKNDKEGIYVMTQLRKYNITKINLNGQDYTTPKFRSAATIDAMCKMFEKKYGFFLPRLIPLLGSAPTRSSSTSQKTTTNRSNSSSPSATKPLPKTPIHIKLYNTQQMTELQMIEHPLGFLSPGSKELTYANAIKQIKDCNLSAGTQEENSYIGFWDGLDNYNMTWEGIKPYSVTCIWVNGKLYSWNYTFYMDWDYKGKTQKESYKIHLAEKIVKTLESTRGIRFTDEDPYPDEDRRYYRRGIYGDHEITIYLKEKDLRVGLYVEVSTTISQYKKKNEEEKVSFILESRNLTMQDLISMPLGIIKSKTDNVWDIPFSEILRGAHKKTNWKTNNDGHNFGISKGFDMTYRGKELRCMGVLHRGNSEDIYKHDWHKFRYSISSNYSSKDEYKKANKEIDELFSIMINDLNTLGITMVTEEDKYGKQAKGEDCNSNYSIFMPKTSFSKKVLKGARVPDIWLMFTVERKKFKKEKW